MHENLVSNYASSYLLLSPIDVLVINSKASIYDLCVVNCKICCLIKNCIRAYTKLVFATFLHALLFHIYGIETWQLLPCNYKLYGQKKKLIWHYTIYDQKCVWINYAPPYFYVYFIISTYLYISVFCTCNHISNQIYEQKMCFRILIGYMAKNRNNLMKICRLIKWFRLLHIKTISFLINEIV